MRKLLLAILFTGIAVSPAAADEIFGGDLQVVEEFAIGTPGTVEPLVLVSDYSNVTNFLGQGFVNGGSALQGANTITRLVADDITPTGVHAGLSITQLKFSVANFNPATVTCRPRVRFWFADGAGGAPGTYYNLPVAVGFSFNPIAIAPGVTILTGTIAPGSFNMPGGPFWAGITFDNNSGATGATAAQLDLMGQGIFDPPTIGSSGDVFYATTGAGSFFNIASPAGALSNLGGNPLANFGWEFTVDVAVPAQTTSWGRIKADYKN